MSGAPEHKPPSNADTVSDDTAKDVADRPRDASTLIIVDHATGTPRVLMGKRRMEQVFMPGKYVFPGGRADKDDKLVQSADELPAIELTKLLLDMKGTPSAARARGLALAAIRETFEEAGILVGHPITPAPQTTAAGWGDFLGHGFLPKLSDLTFFARAITPPGRPRRYDTRFFCCDVSAIAHRIDANDGELSGLHWLTIEDTRGIDLAPITRVVLEDLTDRLGSKATAADAPVPYYHFKGGSFRRELLTIGGPVAS
jgi:8-oxo-dGTP pyrophosphatase MutT (NUDIX family)